MLNYESYRGKFTLKTYCNVDENQPYYGDFKREDLKIRKTEFIRQIHYEIRIMKSEF